MEKVNEARKRDYVSHFLLRLAFARTEELRRWFVSMETDLFRFRYQEEGTKEQQSFMKANNMNFQPIHETEKKKILLKLMDSFPHLAAKIDGIEFFRVPFTDATDLVRHRRAYLQAGYAYIPPNDLVSIITAGFRAHLSHALALTSRMLPEVEADQRIYHLLNDFEKRYTGQDFGSSGQAKPGGTVTPDMLESLSKQSYPLCMRHLHETLRSQHHLKHGGRMQYGLFIKGIGVTLEHSLKFWRDEFTKAIDVDKFEKQHAYNIRHNYGKEGKRVNYTPYSCIKIISQSVGPGDSHGCPFKHFDPTLLRQKLTGYRVAHTVVQEIIDLVSRQHYQIACQRYFEAVHNGHEVEGGLQHPNQYFQDSQKILQGGAKERPAAARSFHKVETIHATLSVKEEVKPEPSVIEGDSDDDYNYSSLDV